MAEKPAQERRPNYAGWAVEKGDKLRVSVWPMEYITNKLDELKIDAQPLRVDSVIVRTGSIEKALLPPARAFFESELSCPLSRADRRGEVRGNCCFHRSRSGKSFVVNVESGRWFCFGCNFGGDQISFLRRRYGLSFIDACKSLGCWDSVSDADRHAIAQKTAERQKKQTEEARLKRLAHEQRIKLRAEIHTTARIQRETSVRLSQLLQGVTPAHDDEPDVCWAVLSLVLDDLRTTESEYTRLAGLEHAA